MKISVVLPCRNEEESVGLCIEKIKETLEGRDYEIVVSDSSTDRSAEIAENLGVKLVRHNLEGYGNAYLEGFKHARGDYIIMGDSDGTYDFSEIPKFIEQLDSGCDMVLGSRFDGSMEEDAMPWLHSRIGTPLMNFLLKLFFKKKISDCNSGFRAIKSQALERLELRAEGMEFASEMIVKAVKKNLKIKEIPISYSKRIGDSKIRPLSDGWRHLRFILLSVRG